MLHYAETLLLLLWLLLAPSPTAAQQILDVSCGAEATIFIDSSGTLVGCGDNSSRILDSNRLPMISMWTKLARGKNWRSISLGSYHCSGIKQDGSLWTWGLSNYRIPGTDSTVLLENPIQIGAGHSWRDVSSGYRLTYAIDTSGSLWGWGFNNSRQISDSTVVNIDRLTLIDSALSWRTVSSSGLHTLAITCDGDLYGWGLNHEGELGFFSDSLIVSKPRLIEHHKWISVSAGFVHSMGITSDSVLLTWGSNDSRQLGIGLKKNPVGKFNTPLPEYRFRYCNAGPTHSFAITTTGLVFAWGYSALGQLGIMSNSRYTEKPALVTMPDSIESIISTKGYLNANGIAGFHTAAITSRKEFLVTGSNYCGQIGLRENKQSHFTYAPISDTSRQLTDCALHFLESPIHIDWSRESATLSGFQSLCSCDSLELYDIYDKPINISIDSVPGGCEFDIEGLEGKWYFLRYIDSDGSVVRKDVDLRK